MKIFLRWWFLLYQKLAPSLHLTTASRAFLCWNVPDHTCWVWNTIFPQAEILRFAPHLMVPKTRTWNLDPLIRPEEKPLQVLCYFFFFIHLQSLHVFKIKIFSNVLFELRQRSLDQCLTHIYFTPYTNKHCTLISHCSGFWSSWCSPHFAATIEVQLWLKVKLCSSLTQLLISVKVLKDSWVGDAKTEE